jgi:hypothetical protein
VNSSAGERALPAGVGTRWWGSVCAPFWLFQLPERRTGEAKSVPDGILPFTEQSSSAVGPQPTGQLSQTPHLHSNHHRNRHDTGQPEPYVSGRKAA